MSKFYQERNHLKVVVSALAHTRDGGIWKEQRSSKKKSQINWMSGFLWSCLMLRSQRSKEA